MGVKRILLWHIDRPFLIVEHASGVQYQNQVNGVVNWQGEIEGVLAPLRVPLEVAEHLAALPYPQGIGGISSEIADSIDSLMSSTNTTNFLKVDRAQLGESCEAWIYVLIESPEHGQWKQDGGYFGSVYGFGPTRGVLTWPNSD